MSGNLDKVRDRAGNKMQLSDLFGESDIYTVALFAFCTHRHIEFFCFLSCALIIFRHKNRGNQCSPYSEYICRPVLLVQNLLAIDDVDSLLYFLQTLAREVVDAAEGGLYGLCLGGKAYAGGINGCEMLYGVALELEGVDAEAGLTDKVYDDSQCNIGLFGKGEAEAAVYQRAPCYGFFLALRIADHGLALAYDKAAFLGLAAVAELDAELVCTGGKRYALPQTVVNELVGKSAPNGLESDVAIVLGVDVCAGGYTSTDNGLGILPF